MSKVSIGPVTLSYELGLTSDKLSLPTVLRLQFLEDYPRMLVESQKVTEERQSWRSGGHLPLQTLVTDQRDHNLDNDGGDGGPQDQRKRCKHGCEASGALKKQERVVTGRSGTRSDTRRGAIYELGSYHIFTICGHLTHNVDHASFNDERAIDIREKFMLYLALL